MILFICLYFALGAVMAGAWHVFQPNAERYMLHAIVFVWPVVICFAIGVAIALATQEVLGK